MLEEGLNEPMSTHETLLAKVESSEEQLKSQIEPVTEIKPKIQTLDISQLNLLEEPNLDELLQSVADQEVKDEPKESTLSLSGTGFDFGENNSQSEQGSSGTNERRRSVPKR